MITISKILGWCAQNEIEVFENQADLNQVIAAPKSITEAEKDNITFLNERFKGDLKRLQQHTNSHLIIIDEKLYKKEDIPPKIAIIISDTPKLILAKICTLFISSASSTKAEISTYASIHSSAKIGENCSIGPFAVIEKNVTIGSNCIIGSSTILKSETTIGNEVSIGSCSVIGGNGFGYIKNEKNNEYTPFPHFGKVIIKDAVDIGSNTCIDRGSLSNTIIEKGVKIDNLVHIAHNASIGENSLVIASAVVAGSVVIGKNCWISPNSSIRDGVKIGDNSTIGLSSTVTKNVSSDKIVVGSPAMDLEHFFELRKIERAIISKDLKKKKDEF